MSDPEFIPDLNNGVVATGISTFDMIALERLAGPTTEPLEFELLIDRLLHGRYKISPSVASNNLTVTIQDLAGSNPSVDNVIPFRVGDTLYNLTATTSFTKNAATNWCNLGSAELAGHATDLFVYAIAESGASAGLKFGFSRIPYALTMADFVNTTTDERYIAGNWTNFISVNPVRLIGRFRAQLSASASFNWSIAAQKVINYPIYETDWLTYTPTRTNVTPGTGPTAGDGYQIRHRNLEAYNSYVLGSGGSLGGALGISLAMAPGSLPGFLPVGQGVYRTAAGVRNIGTLEMNGGALLINVTNAASTYAADNSVAATVPFTWTTSDRFVLRYLYPIG